MLLFYMRYAKFLNSVTFFASIFSAIFLLSACATVVAPAAFDDQKLDQVTWESLEKFGSDREFKNYLKDLQAIAKRRDEWWAQSQYTLLAQNASCEIPEECEEEIVVTASKRSSSSSKPNITNVQSAGVDEGDIVKQIGNHLVVLQDGRLFSVDMGNSQGSMKRIDRIDVYDDADSDTWYDEVLVFDRRILVTGYSYDEEGTELNIIDLNETGQFEKVARFYISSDDYYDPENYATRIMDGNLVIYTPLYLTEYYYFEELEWPIIRRWVNADEWEERIEAAQRQDRTKEYRELKNKYDTILKGDNLFSARNIYKPVQRTANSVVHSISVCPLDVDNDQDNLSCKTTGIVGPEGQEFYVSSSDVYLWLGPGWDDISNIQEDCDPDEIVTPGKAIPSALFQFPLGGGQVRGTFISGAPQDQFSLDQLGDRFRSILKLTPNSCEIGWKEKRNLVFYDFPLSRFSTTPKKIPKRYENSPLEKVPAIYENRFTDNHVVIGGRENWSSRPPGVYSKTEKTETGELNVLPIDDPNRFSKIELNHNIIRLERLGENIFSSGYYNKDGLSLSYVSLDAKPYETHTIVLKGRYESEGRSHAFNFNFEKDEVVLAGLPTVSLDVDSERWWWRSEQSDVSFFHISGDGKVSSFGALIGIEENVHEEYDCEVSCIDWYGNSRPIFTGGRIFALSGTELVEGKIVGSKIAELQRLNLSEPLP